MGAKTRLMSPNTSDYIKSLMTRYGGMRAFNNKLKMVEYETSNWEKALRIRRANRNQASWKIILLALFKEYYDEYGFIPGNTSITRATGVSRSPVQRLFRSLKDDGILRVHKTGNKIVYEPLDMSLLEKAWELYEELRRSQSTFNEVI